MFIDSSATAEKSSNDSQPAWGPERRLEFIDFRLRWERTVNRGDLVDHFRISQQQASADLAKYAERAPGNLVYDKSQKTYRQAPGFQPAFKTHDAKSYLDELESLALGGASPSPTFLGWRPSCDVVRYPARPIATATLLRLLWSIRDGEAVQVRYQSMRRPSPTLRWITPHALAKDGHRWHLRAWCDENQDYRDFVISRVQSVELARKGVKTGTDDAAWHRNAQVVVAPREGLTEGQRSATEIDFGMVDGRLVITCREALLFYLLRQLQLERPPDQPPLVQPLQLVNRAELEPIIAAATKQPTAPSTPESPKGCTS